jgi:Uma2 family endonuclease
MSSLPATLLTPEQYLEIERKAEYKSEYYRGEMFAMAGVGRSHNRIGINLTVLLYSQLRGRPGEFYSSDMRVCVSTTGLYTYPDIIVTSGEPQFRDDGYLDTLLNPAVIIEIPSPSTEAYDRGKKFELYRALESLRDYVLIASERIQVEHFSRQPNGQWLFTAAGRLEDCITVASIGCTLRLADVYEKVKLDS